MNFYYVEPEFIDCLQKVEIESRGFTRIPNIEYDANQNQKFIVGIVFNINGFKYYAPMSHYKKQKPNNVLIDITTDKKNPIKGSIRLNYMFPVLDKYLTKVNIKEITDEKYKRLVQKELNFCINNKNTIRSVALQTYLEVMLKTNPELVLNACDFQLLEKTLNNPPFLVKETEDSDKGLALVE